MNFEEFDKILDTETMNKIAELEKTGGVSGDFEEVPDGKYEVAPEKFEMKVSKIGNPMLTVWFRIVAGTFNKQMIFANFVMNQPFGIYKSKEFVKSLGELGVNVTFESFRQWNDEVVEPISEAVQGLGYVMEYGEDKKGYKTYKIVDGPFEV